MSDLISRADVLSELYLDHEDVIYIDKHETEKRIRAIPSAQTWIPVTERLPEKPGKYLVTVQNGNVYSGTYDAYSKRFHCAAIAWMELPEPYREEPEDDH